MKAIDHIKAALGRVARKVAGPVIGAAIVGYFAFYAVQGDRGLYALKHLETEIAAAKTALASVHGERERMERQAMLLRPDSLDLDMLDERVRTMLNYSKPDEIVLFYPRGGATRQPAGNATVLVGSTTLSSR